MFRPNTNSVSLIVDRALRLLVGSKFSRDSALEFVSSVLVTMLSVKVRFLLFLYLHISTTQSEIIPEMNGIIAEKVTIKSMDNGYMQVQVKVDTKNSCEVIVTTPPAQDNSESTSTQLDKVNGFHTALNCNFSYLAMNYIYEFLYLSPLLYQYKFQDFDIYKEGLESEFTQNFNKLKNILENFAKRSINILNNVLDSNTNILYYRDTSTLEALMSLQMKIDYLSEIEDKITIDGKHHFNIIRLVLNDMATIQRYFSINCYGVRTDNTNSQWYGYDVDTSDDKRIPMKEFFDAVTKNEKLVGTNQGKVEGANQKKCTFYDKILDDIIPEKTKDGVDILTNILTKTLITLTDGRIELVSLQSINYQVHNSYFNNQVLYWYQHFFIVILMKIIFNTMLYNFQYFNDDDTYKETIWFEINTINQTIAENYRNYPELLITGFTILRRTFDVPHNSYINALTEFNNSLSMDSISLSYEIPKDSKGFLLTIIHNIQVSIYKFRCFQEIFKTLQDKHLRYFIPFIADTSILRPANPKTADSDKKHFQRVCGFLKNVYSLCYLAVMFLQEDFMDNFYGVMGKEIPDFSKRLQNILKLIRHYFLLIIKKRSLDKILLKMAYAIAPLLVSLLKRIETNFSPNEIGSVLDLIMAELNINGTFYCNSRKTNFSLFNIINFYNLGNQEMVDESMKDFYQFSVVGFVENDLNVKSITSDDYNHLDTKYLFTNYVNDSNILQTYKEIILFYWNGSFRTIHSVFESNISSLKNVYDFYALYDMIFKFYLAVFYHELKNISNKKNLGKKNKKFRESRIVMDSFQEIFPRYLKPFVLAINKFINANLEVNPNEDNIKVHRNQIDQTLNKFNIIYKKPKKSYISIPCFPSPSVELDIEIFKEELTKIVKNLHAYFKKFNE